MLLSNPKPLVPIIRIFFFSVLFLSAAGAETVKVLTVGNSFSDNACRYLGDIAESAGKSIEIHKANLGGASLKRHWTHVDAWRKDPASEEARPLTRYEDKQKIKVSLHELLVSEDWDFITVQQASFRSHRAETFEPYGSELVAFIAEYAPEAEILVHQTWAYRVDDERFGPEKNMDQEKMYELLTENYLALAERAGELRVLPVGAAFQEARRSDRWNLQVPDFDPESLTYPQLPNTRQSLNSGWEWKQRDGERYLYLDSSHANVNGEYLGGLIWFGVIFNEDPRNVTFRPTSDDPQRNISEEDAALLREFAYQTLVKYHDWFR